MQKTTRRRRRPNRSASGIATKFVRILRSGRRGIRGARRKDEGGRAAAVKGGGGLPRHVRSGDRAGIGRGSLLLPPQRKGGPFVACRLATLLLLSGPLASRLAPWSRFLPTYLLPTCYLPPPHHPWLVPPAPPQLWQRSSVTKINAIRQSEASIQPFLQISCGCVYVVCSLYLPH
jgi:hypothetical protein